MFKVGDLAVYPAHGLGVVKRLEAKEIGGKEQNYYVLQILATGATLLIPVESSERAGMRKPISDDVVEKIYEVFRTPAKKSTAPWNRRFRAFNDTIRSGDALAIAEVLRDLTGLRRDQDLSYGEMKMMQKALSMLTEEIGAATTTDEKDVEKDLRGRLGI